MTFLNRLGVWAPLGWLKLYEGAFFSGNAFFGGVGVIYTRYFDFCVIALKTFHRNFRCNF